MTTDDLGALRANEAGTRNVAEDVHSKLRALGDLAATIERAIEEAGPARTSVDVDRWDSVDFLPYPARLPVPESVKRRLAELPERLREDLADVNAARFLLSTENIAASRARNHAAVALADAADRLDDPDNALDPEGPNP